MSKRFLAMILMIFVLATVTRAQGSAVKSAASGGKPTTSSNTATSADGKLAIVDSAQFGQGIGEMKKQIDKIDVEFKPRITDLENVQKQLVTLDDELKANGNNMKEEILNQKVEQGKALKKDFERKREDLQVDYQKRYEVATAPIQDKIRKFLESYANQHQIAMIFDYGPATQGGMIFSTVNTNITEDFIKEYNKLNPAP